MSAWSDYLANPNSAKNMPNNSYAGYHYGEDSLPSPSSKILDVTQAPFDAKGDGATDDLAAVRKAIAAAAIAGGIVYFPAGNYALSGPLFVNDSNVILRGEDPNTTTLTFTRSLTDGYTASANAAGTSNWSNQGGLIWFSPRALTPNPVPQNFNLATAWSMGPYLADVTAEAHRGDVQLTVSDTSHIPAGALIALQMTNPNDMSLAQHLSGDGAWASKYPWSSATELDNFTMTWPVEPVTTAGNTVTLRQPLRFDVRAAWQPRLFVVNPPVRESGVEKLTIAMRRTAAWSLATHHNEVGFNGVFFSNAFNCFVRSVTVVDSEGLAFAVNAAKNITFTDVHVSASNATMSPHHHAMVARTDAQDILFQNFSITSQPLHGLSVDGRAMGVVWSNGTMSHGTFDTHKLLPVDCIRTQVSLTNDGTAGGDATGGPPMGARFVSWNVQVTGKIDMVGSTNLMPFGAVIAVTGLPLPASVDPTQGDSMCAEWPAPGSTASPTPVNVYEAERILRIGR